MQNRQASSGMHVSVKITSQHQKKQATPRNDVPRSGTDDVIGTTGATAPIRGSSITQNLFTRPTRLRCLAILQYRIYTSISCPPTPAWSVSTEIAFHTSKGRSERSPFFAHSVTHHLVADNVRPHGVVRRRPRYRQR